MYVFSIMKNYIFIIFSVMLHLVTVSTNAQDTYKVAVVEFATKEGLPQSLNRVLENVGSYVYYMENAAEKNAQIIIFPEYGLTGVKDINNDTVYELSTEIPDPALEISPCRTPVFSKALIDLSCAAATHKIYTVVNLIERELDAKTQQDYYYNANVVFNENGIVIARYRKINLYNEFYLTPGNQTVTFRTNFGVTFGMFTCFDILFKNPSIEILANASSVTDVIYTSAWFSKLPFYGGDVTALSIQHGYAKANRVNLMVSALNDPSVGNGGSGIYLNDGSIAQTYISGIKSTKILIQDIPKIHSNLFKDDCQLQRNSTVLAREIGVPQLPGGKLPDISNFITKPHNLASYTFKLLSLNESKISENVCSGSFCCSFNISLIRDSSIQLNYRFKLIAFYGVKGMSSNRSIGVQSCALVTCLNDTNESCGYRQMEAPKGVIFEAISVNGNFSSSNTHIQPTTVTHKLGPITEYTFCRKQDNKSLEIEMKTTNSQDSLLTFGLYGRLFDYDDTPPRLISSASSLSKSFVVTIGISILIFVLQN